MLPTLQILNGLKILHVTVSSAKDGWLTAAVREISDLTLSVQEAFGTFEGLKALQSESYDVVLISLRPVETALDFITGCRTSGTGIPMLILGNHSDSNLLTRCCERGGNGCISLENATLTDLLWQTAIVVQNYRNWDSYSKSQLDSTQELEEALGFSENLLDFAKRREGRVNVSPELAEEYLTLLKTYIPGLNSRVKEQIHDFAQILRQKKASAAQLFALHAQTLETILRTPGRKSPFRLTNRANLLLTELTAELVDSWEAKSTGSFADSEFFLRFPKLDDFSCGKRS